MLDSSSYESLTSSLGASIGAALITATTARLLEPVLWAERLCCAF